MSDATNSPAGQPRVIRRVDASELEPWQQELLRESRAQAAVEQKSADAARAAARRLTSPSAARRSPSGLPGH